MQFIPISSEIFQKGEKIFEFFFSMLKKNKIFLEENSVCIISSKILALSQKKIEKSEKFLEILEKESEKIINQKGEFFLTEKHGIIIPNAGIDKSNSKAGEIILWPENVWAEAEIFREKLREKFSLKNIGIIFSDSRITPKRKGSTGVALAWSGILGVQDFRGETDIFGNKLEVSTMNTADNLVCAAEILMGQADEKTPFVVGKNIPKKIFTEKKQSQEDYFISSKEDLF